MPWPAKRRSSPVGLQELGLPPRSSSARGATVAVNFLADDARDRESVSRLKTQGIKAIEAPGNSWRWRGPRPHGGEGDRRPTLAASTCSLPRRAIRPSSTITTHASGLKHSVDQSPYCSAPASLQAHLIRCPTDQIRHNDYSGCGKTTEFGDGRPANFPRQAT